MALDSKHLRWSIAVAASNFVGSVLIAVQSGNYEIDYQARRALYIEGFPLTLPVFRVSMSKISKPGAHTRASLLLVKLRL